MSPNDRNLSGGSPPRLPPASPTLSPSLPGKRERKGSGKGEGKSIDPRQLARDREETDDAQRRIAFRFGLSAESRAAALLIAKGYRILARRFRTPLGEIDIVARRRGVLVFVEVKARDSFDTAAEAIGKRQQNRIISAAQLWLADHPEDAMRDMRFDAVLVVPGRVPRHLQAAFDASA
jgi:putative endonuclease